jgi:hypothetical protein
MPEDEPSPVAWPSSLSNLTLRPTQLSSCCAGLTFGRIEL